MSILLESFSQVLLKLLNFPPKKFIINLVSLIYSSSAWILLFLVYNIFTLPLFFRKRRKEGSRLHGTTWFLSLKFSLSYVLSKMELSCFLNVQKKRQSVFILKTSFVCCNINQLSWSGKQDITIALISFKMTCWKVLNSISLKSSFFLKINIFDEYHCKRILM